MVDSEAASALRLEMTDLKDADTNALSALGLGASRRCTTSIVWMALQNRYDPVL